MYSASRGIVIDIISDLPDFQELTVKITDSGLERAYNYPLLYKRVAIGETVLLNTSAVKLGLGTGGRHFVIPEDMSHEDLDTKGHIMKLRYTPWQFPVLAVEEEKSPYHELLQEQTTLDGVPVVSASLHSMLPGIILGFKTVYEQEKHQRPKVSYVMTDGAALPIALSNLVRELREKDLLDLTVTAGHAFGGDLEAVGIPSAIMAAHLAGQADLIIVALGPGIAGTGTALGFSGIEQSWVIDLTARLKGIPIITPRISTADKRSRHFGISHHTVTILDLASNPAYLPLSKLLPSDLRENVTDKLREKQLLNKHRCLLVEDPPVEELFKEYNIKVKTMGRDVQQERAFFQSSVSAGVLAAQAALNQLDGLDRLV